MAGNKKTIDLSEWFSRYKPLPKQAKFHELCRDRRFVLMCTGVRFGKTYSGARQVARFVYEQKLKPNLGWLLVPSYKTGQQAAQELVDHLEPCILHKTGSPGKPMTLYLRPPVGYPYPQFILDVRSAENENLLRGAKLAFAWVDEARDVSESAYNILLQRVADTAGKIIFTTTPRGRGNWLFERVYKRAIDGHNDYGYVTASTYENTFLDSAVIEELEKDFPSDFGRQELYGEFVNVSGLVYPTFNTTAHAVEPFKVPSPFEAQAISEPAPRVFLAIDFGFEDPFVCLWMMFWRGKFWVVDEVYVQHKDTAAVSSKIVAHPLTKYAEAAYCDGNDLKARVELKARLKELKSKLQVYPAPRDGSGRSRNFDVGIRLIRRLLAQGQLVVFRSCGQTIREFGLYHYKASNEDKNSQDVPVDKWNHAMDALRYGLRSWQVYRGGESATGGQETASSRIGMIAKIMESRNHLAEEVAQSKTFEPWYLGESDD